MSAADLQFRIDDFLQKQPLDLGEGLSLLEDARSHGSDEQVNILEELLHVNDPSMERTVECFSKLNEFQNKLVEVGYEDALSESREALSEAPIISTTKILEQSEFEIEKVAERAKQIEGEIKKMEQSFEGTFSGFKKSLDKIEKYVKKTVENLKERETSSRRHQKAADVPAPASGPVPQSRQFEQEQLARSSTSPPNSAGGVPPPQGYPAGYAQPQGYQMPGAAWPGMPMGSAQPQGYQMMGVPQQGYPWGGVPPQALQMMGVPPQVLQMMGVPPQGYPGAPPQQGYPGAPPQQGYPGAPSSQGYPGAPSSQGYPR